MVEEWSESEAGAGDLALLEDDVLAVPSHARGAAVGPDVRFGSECIVVAAMKARSEGGFHLVATAQSNVDQPFPPPGSETRVNDTVYEAVLGAASASDGRVALVGVRADDMGIDLILQNQGESTTGPALGAISQGGGWDRAIDLGRPGGGGAPTSLQLGLDAQGHLAIFALSASGEVRWLYKKPPQVVEVEISITPPGTSEPITITVPELRPADPPYSDWMTLDGPPLKKLVLSNNADGRVILVGITSDNAGGEVVYNELCEMHSTKAPDWFGWTPVATEQCAPYADIAASLDGNGAVNVFAVDSQREISHAKQTEGGGRVWTRYFRPGLTCADLGLVAAGLDGSGNIAIGASASDGLVWTNQEAVGRTTMWTGWQPSAQALQFEELAFEYQASGSLMLFGLERQDNRGGTVRVIAQAAPDSTEWSATAPTVLEGVGTMAVVRDLAVSPQS